MGAIILIQLQKLLYVILSNADEGLSYIDGPKMVRVRTQPPKKSVSITIFIFELLYSMISISFPNSPVS